MNEREERDASSHAIPHEVRVVHLHWEAAVDFEKNKISAEALLTVERMSDEATCLRLDIKHLILHAVSVEDDREINYDVKYVVHEITKEYLGQCLEVELPEVKSNKFKVRIKYETTEMSSAVQWLPPQQTADKKYPYMFTQCQAIHARSLVPCQDCPGVKMSYSAAVTVPSWATCLMSAVGTHFKVNDHNSTKTFCFKQKIPIPAYLIAVAVGDLKGIDVSHRCRVWSEPSVVEAAAFEFSQTEEFLRIAESLTLPYQWGRYDLLCLPPSFPYGGMENPCLTFVTPTLLAGDKSLADVVAHEIAHSWTGNLVTNNTWEHFWLNEGWTVWLERKIMAKISGDNRIIDFEAIAGWQDLKESVELLPGNYSKLVPKLGLEDPDEAYSSVPYEKGFMLLYTLENLVGSEQFSKFLKAYLEEFKFRTCDSEKFRAFFEKSFEHEIKIKNFDWEKWLYCEGMPIKPEFNRELSEAAINLAKAWDNFDRFGGAPPKINITDWSSKMKTSFLDALLASCDDNEKPLKLTTIALMRTYYSLNNSCNAEVLFRWCRICIKSGLYFSE